MSEWVKDKRVNQLKEPKILATLAELRGGFCQGGQAVAGDGRIRVGSSYPTWLMSPMTPNLELLLS